MKLSSLKLRAHTMVLQLYYIALHSWEIPAAGNLEICPGGITNFLYCPWQWGKQTFDMFVVAKLLQNTRNIAQLGHTKLVLLSSKGPAVR
jgi:hypothetical protein